MRFTILTTHPHTPKDEYFMAANYHTPLCFVCVQVKWTYKGYRCILSCLCTQWHRGQELAFLAQAMASKATSEGWKKKLGGIQNERFSYLQL